MNLLGKRNKMTIAKKLIGLSIVPIIIIPTTISCSDTSLPIETVYPKLDIKKLSAFIKGSNPTLDAAIIEGWIQTNKSYKVEEIVDPQTNLTTIPNNMYISSPIDHIFFESILINSENISENNTTVKAINFTLKLKNNDNKSKKNYLFKNNKKTSNILIKFTDLFI
ncbi:MAG: hypothetical protein ACRDA7_01130 [Metamycoplasmataceae bacterium]